MADVIGTRHGTYLNTPTLSQGGALLRNGTNTSVAFNGTNEFGKVLGSSLGQIKDAFTVEAWIRPGLTTGVHTIVGTRSPSDFEFDAKLCEGGAFCTGQHIRVDLGNGSSPWLASGNIPFAWQANRWYHVMFTVDEASGTLAVYVDGEQIGGLAFTPLTSNPLLTDSSRDLFIGQSGTGAEYFNGRIDEVTIYKRALTAAEARGHRNAGIGAVARDATAVYDDEGHPTEAASRAELNGDFGAGLESWVPVGAAAASSALVMDSAEGASQDVALLPGSTVRVQFTGSAASGGAASYRLAHWDSANNEWDLFTDSGGPIDGDITGASTSKAFDVTVPFTSDGRIRVQFANDNGVGTGTIDNVAVLVGWTKTVYAADGTTSDGLPTSTFSLASGTPATVETKIAYATTGNGRPAVVPTSVTANYVLGDPVESDKNVPVSTTVYDLWGRPTSVTDADGVATTTTFATNNVDAASTADGLGNATTFTYDAVGNKLTTTTPLGRSSTTAYDPLNRVTSVLGPDLTESRNVYSLGRLDATIANYEDGTSANGALDIDLIRIDDLATTYAYDSFGRLLSTVADDAAGGGASGIKTKAVSTYDLFDTVTSSKVYTDSAWTEGTSRTTTAYYETANNLSRSKPTAAREAIAPSGSPALLCPGEVVYCNSVAKVDFNGRPYLVTNAYGVASLTDVDLGGRVVQSIAGYQAGAAPDADTNVTTTTVYDIAGRPILQTDPLGRRTATEYDRLGRATKVSTLDAGASVYSYSRTVYTGAGRVERSSTAGASDGQLVWTKNIYDAAGRLVKTLDHYDIAATDVRFFLHSFEQNSLDPAWSTAAWGPITASGAVVAHDGHYNFAQPANGRGRMKISTSGAATGQGASWLVPGNFKQGQPYRLTGRISGYLGREATVRLGPSTGGSNQTFTFTGSYAQIDRTWVPSADTTAGRISIFASDPSATAFSIYLDDLVVWDDSTGEYWNIPTETVYDADGRAIESIIPPGDPAVDEPLVTETGYDANGQVVAVSVANRRRLPAAILGETGVGYWPLDEAAGTVEDRDLSFDLTPSGTPVYGVAGAASDGRTAIRFDGAAALSRTSNVTSAVNNYAAEAWVRIDAPPAATQTIFRNGDGANGWGLAVTNPSGYVVAEYETSNSTTLLATTKSVTDGAWHHLALVRNANVTTIYVDGVAHTPSSSTTTPGTPGNGFSVGRQDAGVQRLVGDIDEVAVYPGILSAADVTAHFNAGRITTVDANLATKTAYDALGRATSTTDPTGTVTRSAPDRLGRAIHVYDNFLNGAAAGTNTDDDLHSRFAYNALGEMTAFCPPRATMSELCSPTSTSPGTAAYDSGWHYAYDALGRMSKQTPPDNVSGTDLSTTEWLYELGGRPDKICERTAAGSCASPARSVEFDQDNLGRTTVTRAIKSGSPTITTTLTYFADGQIATSNENSDTLTLTYDATTGLPDLVKRSSTTLTNFDWNPDGTLALRTDGTLGQISFAYDWAKRETTVTPPSAYFGPGSVTTTYGADGLLATKAFPNGETASLAYDDAKRPTAINLTASRNLARTYDRDGNVTAESRELGIVGPAGQFSQTFTYDAVGRITGATVEDGTPVAETYTWDRNGNRLTKSDRGSTFAYTYNRSDQLINQAKDGALPDAFSYDAAGNTTTERTWGTGTSRTLAYDAANRLITVTPSAGTGPVVSQTYDGLGRTKTRAVAGGATQTFNFVGASESVWKLDTGTAATTVTDLVGSDASRLASRTNANPTDVRWLLFDLLGSVAGAEATTTTTITESTRYDAFGQTLAIYPTGGTTVPWKFRGLLDVSSNADPLYAMGARDYSPHTGTFTELDTYAGSAQNPASMNRYLYAESNPTTFIDPTGHASYGPGQICPYGPEDCEGWKPKDLSTDSNGGGTGGSTKNSNSAKNKNSNAGGADAPYDCRKYGECGQAPEPWNPPSWTDYVLIRDDPDVNLTYTIENGAAALEWLRRHRFDLTVGWNASAFYVALFYLRLTDPEGYAYEGAIALEEYLTLDQMASVGSHAFEAGDSDTALFVANAGMIGIVGWTDPYAPGASQVGGSGSRGNGSPSNSGHGGPVVNHWGMSPYERGRLLEAKVLQGMEGTVPLASNNKTIDAWIPATGSAVSVKSIDLNAPSYRNSPSTVERRLNGFVTSLRGYTQQNWGGVVVRPGQVRSRTLIVVVPPGTKASFQASFTTVTSKAGGGTNPVHIVVMESP